MTLVSKSFSEIVTFSRSSNATRVGPTGVLEYAPHNLLTYSEQFGSWSTAGGSVSSNTSASPDGTVTADTYTIASGGDYLYNSATVSASTTYTVSIFVKAGTKSSVRLQYTVGGFADRVYIDINPSAGTIGSVQTVGIATAAAATIQSVGSGWYRVTLTGNLGSATTGYIVIGNDSGTGTVLIWGAQLAVGPYALDYTPTTSAAVYGPRFDYDPVTLAARGLLVEEQRTNLCPYSEQLNAGSWNTAAVTFVNNAGTAPSGETTADKISPASSGTLRFVYYVGLGSTLSSSTVYTISMFLKASGKNWGYLRYEDKSDANAYVYFNLSTGVVGSTTGTLSVTSKIENYGNGWYRCTVTGNSGTGAGGFNPILFGVADADGSTSVTVSGTDGILAWGAQLEAGSFATSYIPTLASAVTRSADVASVNTLSPWMNQTEGTIFAEYSFYGADAAFNNTAVMLTDGTENNYEALFGYTPAYGWVQSGGATSAGLTTGGATAINTNYKSALAFKANDFAFSINGASPATDTSGTVPTVTEMLLGRRVASSKPLHGHLRRVAFFPRRLSNAELQALTA